MGRGLRRFFELIVPAALVVLLLASSWTHASATIVAMAGDSAGVPVAMPRGIGGNSVSVSSGSPTVLATSAQYPSALSTHDGGIVVTWNSAVTAVASSVFGLRWTLPSGWTSVADPLSRTPDTVIRDLTNTNNIQDNVIERPDQFGLLGVGNLGGRANETTLVFN